jgi:GTP-binding protein EngB required for normal cell division
MSNDNCFLLLGKTGVGKSTLSKILSENQSIVIGDSLHSQTKETNCYECQMDDFKYTLIDTPGYDDSEGNDAKNFSNIKQFLTSNNHKIKGIVLMFSFQDARFGESHRKGLEKIVNLIPLDNFWRYITIIFTKTFLDDDDELEEMKNQRLKDFKEIFDTLINAFYKVKLVKKVEFSEINTLFVNLKKNKTKKENLKNIISILKDKAKLEPLFHHVTKEEKWEQFLVLHKDNRNIGDLYNVKFKIYNYLNQNGDIIKSISHPVDKKHIKQLEKKEYDGKFQNNCKKAFFASDLIGIASFCGTLALETICPPVATALLALELTSFGVWTGSAVIGGIKTASEYLSNKEFNEQKVIDELKLEEDSD